MLRDEDFHRLRDGLRSHAQDEYYTDEWRWMAERVIQSLNAAQDATDREPEPPRLPDWFLALTGALNTVGLQYSDWALKMTDANRASHVTVSNAFLSLAHKLQKATQTGDGAATPPATAPTTTPAATGGEQQADESATGAATPGHAPSPPIAVPVELLDSLVSTELCQYDHNGDCQEHGYFGLAPQRCPHSDGRILLKNAGVRP
jgi:hypothetical protein